MLPLQKSVFGRQSFVAGLKTFVFTLYITLQYFRDDDDDYDDDIESLVSGGCN